MTNQNGIKVSVCQVGARLHYGAARSFQLKGALGTLYTDICALKGWPSLLRTIPRSLRPAALKRLLGRVPIGIPKEKIETFPRLGIEYQWRLSKCKSEGDRIRAHLQMGKQFSERIVRRGFRGATHVYTISGAGLEVLEAARALGVRAVVELPQAASGVHHEILKQEHERFPDWEPFARGDEERREFEARERMEWDVADTIIVPSTFVASSLEKVGISPDRYTIVPYGVGDFSRQTVRAAHDGPLRVLTVGSVTLRKGPQYTFEALKLLGKGFDFRLVGGCSFSESIKRELGRRLHLMGDVPRSEVREQFQWADVFLLPSLCEGMATVLIEALSSGLPVIATANCGLEINDGVDGFLVPIRSPAAIAEKLNQLASDPALLSEMSRNAKKRSEDFTLEAYSERLYSAMAGIH
jgi:glycosyltransferase involved in cell wall biosynthesis